jgi:hypothetical protein
VCVLDGRGTHVTLSHFCPTAASSLFRTDVPLAIVGDPPAFPAGWAYEGLDARDALPPLLRPGMLMDLESYHAWERHVVATLARASHTPASAIAQLAADAQRLCSWTPPEGPLVERVTALAARGERTPAGAAPAWSATVLPAATARYDRVRGCVPVDLQPPPIPPDAHVTAASLVDPEWDAHREPLKRYLAARAFATWVAWQGQGLAAVVESLALSLAVVYIESIRQCRAAGERLDERWLREAIRQADLLLVHRASPEQLAAAASSPAAPSAR